MPEYVYALHDFTPEHEDEVPFRAGERIEVIEKDDQFGDGWWQGRNLAGRVGLFPQSYTAPAPPPANAAASTEALPATAPAAPDAGAATTAAIIPLPADEPESASNGLPDGHAKSPSNDGAVMAATLTDVQKAIEQLGQHTDRDSSRSFSFRSSHDGEFDLTDRSSIASNPDDEEGGAWHRDARRKLAEKSRLVVEAQREREEREQEELMATHAAQPPVDEGMISDESDGEEDHAEGLEAMKQYSLQVTPRDHPHIPEEEEEEEDNLHHGGQDEDAHRPAAAEEHTALAIPSVKDEDVPTARHDQIAFPASAIPELVQLAPQEHPEPHTEDSPAPPSLPTPTSPASLLPAHQPASIDYAAVSSTQQPQYPPSGTGNALQPAAAAIPTSISALPSPAASISSAAPQQPQTHSKHISNGSSLPETTSSLGLSKSTTHPTEWTVDEVVEWLTAKGFSDVVEKFVEQEITGDVLLELDANLLKTELGIMAFGKRVRIANAIGELRRPPSVGGQSATHSSSAGGMPQFPPNSGGLQSSVVSQESPPHTGDLLGTPARPSVFDRRVSDPGSSINGGFGYGDGSSLAYNDDFDRSTAGGGSVTQPQGPGVGLGFATAAQNAIHGKGRPAQLSLSPSDSQLRATAVSQNRDIPEEDEPQAAMSDNEVMPAQKARRRLWGRSTGSDGANKRDSVASNASTSNGNKDMVSPKSISGPSPTSEGTGVFNKQRASADGSVSSRHSRNKRSVDASKGGSERLSLFGNAFGSVGKSRKPAPSVSDEKIGSHFSLGKVARKGSGKSDAPVNGTTPPSTNGRDPYGRDALDEKEKNRDPALLRKRTASTGEVPTKGMQKLEPGKSIIEQIGGGDHNGWMRKKGDRYNTWKLRYFILKGPHLYYLRSNSKSETKIKGYINIKGYKVVADENVNPGRYGFQIIHDAEKTHFFSSEEQIVIREWMKAIMKATIGRDYTRAVVSSCNIPTIPLTVAQAMNPAPRPPSPTQRAATQKSYKRENPNQLSSRDARILMGLPSPSEGGGTEDSSTLRSHSRLNSIDSTAVESINNGRVSGASTPKPKSAPPRPARESRRISAQPETMDYSLIDWANSHLPASLQIIDTGSGALCGGLPLLRIAESIKGRPSSPPVPDSAFPSGPSDDKLDGLFRLFDFLLDNDVKLGTVSINDVRLGRRDKIISLLKALRSWEEKRAAILSSIGKSAVQAGPFIAPGGTGMPFGNM